MTEPTGPSFSSRLPSVSPIRLAIVAGVGIVLALSAAITLAASPSPQNGVKPAAPAGSPGPNHVGPRPGIGAFGPSFGGPGFGGRGFSGPGFGGPGGGVTIASIDGSTLSLTTADGWTRTITVGSSTKIMRAGQTIALSDLRMGDTIAFRQSKASDGSFKIDAINVVLPRVFGQVTATTSSTITIKQFDGTSLTIHVGGSTTFRIMGVATASISSLKVGMTISAEGTKATDGSFDALDVAGGQFRISLPGGPHKLPGGKLPTPAGPSGTSAPGA